MPKTRDRSRRRAAKRAGFRSAFEQEVYNDALANGGSIEFEPKDAVIEYQPKPKKYKPDFRLANGIIVETKGRFTVFDRQKHLRIKEQHPDLDLRFVLMYDNKLDKRSDTTYSEWCEKMGFKWAMKRIPKGWLNE